LEEATGYRSDTSLTPSPRSSQSSTRSEVVFDQSEDGIDATLEETNIQSMSKKVVEGGLNALELFGKKTIVIVNQTREKISPAMNQLAANVLDGSNVDLNLSIEDLSISAMDLFATGTGPSDLEVFLQISFIALIL
jgi:hypothetical protein